MGWISFPGGMNSRPGQMTAGRFFRTPVSMITGKAETRFAPPSKEGQVRTFIMLLYKNKKAIQNFWTAFSYFKRSL